MISKLADIIPSQKLRRIAAERLEFEFSELDNQSDIHHKDPWRLNAEILEKWKNRNPQRTREVKIFKSNYIVHLEELCKFGSH